MIRNPNDIQDGAKKIRMLIAGYPGIGKSTLALSAPRPLHIDCDFGIDRIEPRYRMPYIQPRSYDEILNDLKPENLKDFETLVFDTAGKLITLMGLWAIKQNPKYGQRDGSLSLKGYGFVGRESVRLMDYCFYELKKNIVVVFHATEEKDGDNTRLRIKVEGQTKNNVWEPMDLGGFVEMYGNDRTIGFSNCERYFAKGTRGIHGVYKIPALGPGSPNDFLTKLFEEYNSKADEEGDQVGAGGVLRHGQGVDDIAVGQNHFQRQAHIVHLAVLGGENTDAVVRQRAAHGAAGHAGGQQDHCWHQGCRYRQRCHAAVQGSSAPLDFPSGTECPVES